MLIFYDSLDKGKAHQFFSYPSFLDNQSYRNENFLLPPRTQQLVRILYYSGFLVKTAGWDTTLIIHQKILLYAKALRHVKLWRSDKCVWLFSEALNIVWVKFPDKQCDELLYAPNLSAA